MVTIENLDKPIQEHKCSNGLVVTMLDNQCMDVEDKVALELLKEYPWLKVLSTTQMTKVTVGENFAASNNEPNDHSRSDETKEDPSDFLDKLRSEDQVACSMCGRLFKNNTGRSAHMRFTHKVK